MTVDGDMRAATLQSWPDPDRRKFAVALFRPRDEAEGSAARLRHLGFAVASLPAVAVAAFAVATRLRHYDAVVATSANAFLAEAPVDRKSPLFVVGGRTARAAEQRGWRLGAPPAPDSLALADCIGRAIPPGAAVLYLAGRDRKPTIEAALGAVYELEVVVAYAAEARDGWSREETEALADCQAALHYSRRSAALAAALAAAAVAAEHFRAMTHVCLSPDVAQPLEALGAARIVTASSPEEEQLFTALVAAAAVFPSYSGFRI